ncbi:MAG: hypothetical protein ABH841_00855 [Candidatus Nealsonbacteria bacterium]
MGYIGDIVVANVSYSGDLSKMTIQELRDRLWHLDNTPNPDTDEGFEAKMVEIDAIKEELKRKGYKDPEDQWPWLKNLSEKDKKKLERARNYPATASGRIITNIADFIKVKYLIKFFKRRMLCRKKL